MPPCSATLFGDGPVVTVSTSASPFSFTARTLTSPLPALVTKRCAPSLLSTTEPCEVRWGVPSPAPPVAYEPSSDSEPSASRRNAITRLPSASLVWTNTAGCFESCIAPPFGGGHEHCLHGRPIRYKGRPTRRASVRRWNAQHDSS